MKVLVYIETKEGAPVPGSLELLTAAKELGETVAVAAEDHAVGLSILCLTFLNCLCKVCCNSTFICACENIVFE